MVVRTFFLYKKLGSFCARGLVRAYPGVKKCARVVAYGLFGCPKLWLILLLVKFLFILLIIRIVVYKRKRFMNLSGFVRYTV